MILCVPLRREGEEPEEDLGPTVMRKRGISRGEIPLREGLGMGLGPPGFGEQISLPCQKFKKIP